MTSILTGSGAVITTPVDRYVPKDLLNIATEALGGFVAEMPDEGEVSEVQDTLF